MSIDLLGPSLEYLHSRGFLHHDLKPNKFLMGLGRKANQVYTIHYGLAMKYRDLETHKHLQGIGSLWTDVNFSTYSAVAGKEWIRKTDAKFEIGETHE
ncbi:hypothetical protein K1719_029970 [Acacia pycnantha]|nr:hypothetical protein K1719_029970 [Acacia pycnantha]